MDQYGIILWDAEGFETLLNVRSADFRRKASSQGVFDIFFDFRTQCCHYSHAEEDVRKTEPQEHSNDLLDSISCSIPSSGTQRLHDTL
jgi:hypothetical protein